MLALGISGIGFADEETKELEKTDLVPSGTYKVTAEIVDAEEEELYVKTQDGKTLELYLKESTKLMKGKEKVEFSALEKGQKLKVKVENTGSSLTPKMVKIMEKKGKKEKAES
ncbi:MAG: hypothetical protein CMO55_02105 [Verrucomicrobiales bacterium]|nr:hypothetical protein [Verrucomicrobiales bacterium]